MNAIVLYRIDQAGNMHRFLPLRRAAGILFAAWCLMREWGRIGSTGQTRSVPFPMRKKRKRRSTGIRTKESRGYLQSPR